MTWFLDWDGTPELDINKSSQKDWVTNSEARILIEMIRSMENSCVSNLANNNDLKLLYQDLDKIQNQCRHDWEVALLFVRFRCFCLRCDKENKDYVHPD